MDTVTIEIGSRHQTEETFDLLSSHEKECVSFKSVPLRVDMSIENILQINAFIKISVKSSNFTRYGIYTAIS